MALALDEKDLLEQLLRSPRLPRLVRELENTIEDEAIRRQAFYSQITEKVKAEFINGEVIIHSPVKRRHNDASSNLHVLLKAYVNRHKLGYIGYEKILISLTRNDYEPDICFFKRSKSDVFTPDQMFFPSPDLSVEVLSDSTASNDRGMKFDDYAHHNVEEYWIIDPVTEEVEQYRAVAGEYELVMKAQTGLLRSFAVDGFEIPIRAIFDDDENQRALVEIITGRR
ncbi:MAG: Uma2 family endonuclease [Chloroflexota bacterium]